MGIIPAPVGIGVFIAAIVVTRIIQERALRKLDTLAKGRLVEAFSAFRIASLVPLAGVAALYFVMTSIDSLTLGMLLAIYLPGMLVFTVVMQWLIHRKLVALGVDREYLRVYSISRGVMLMAFVVMMLSV
jgi:hypothetical protein